MWALKNSISCFTAYDSQVHSCMIWKHDICLLDLPKKHSGGIDPNLDRLFQNWLVSFKARPAPRVPLGSTPCPVCEKRKKRKMDARFG